MTGRRLGAVAVVAALIVGACGGDKGGSADGFGGGADARSAEPGDTGAGTGPVDGGGLGAEPGDTRGSGGTDPDGDDPDAAPGDQRGGSDRSGGDGSVVTDDYFYTGLGRASPPGGVFIDVSAGPYVTCGVRDSGEIDCWGDSFGEVPEGEFTAVSVLGAGACALAADGSVVCWDGSGSFDAPDREFVEVAGGCGLRRGGQIECFGDDGYGQLGVPVGDFEHVYGGPYHACALDASGVLVCWGDGHGFWGSPPDRRSVPDAPSGEFVSLSAASSSGSDRRDPGVDYVCGLRASGGISCWAAAFGEGHDFGQADAPFGEFTSVSAGAEHACAIDVEGRVVCWGNRELRVVEPVRDRWGWTVGGDYCRYVSAYDNAAPEGPLDCRDYGGEGVFEPIGQDHPYRESLEYWGVHDGAPDPLRGPFVQVSAGVQNTCAVRFDSVLVCWSGLQGVDVLDGEFSQVALGAAHGCALRAGGEVVCWGIGPDDERWEAQTEAPAGVFSQVSAGDDHTCGLRVGGAVACWGDDGRGRIDAPSGEFVQVSAVGDGSCALGTDGTPLCWGAVAGLRPPPGEFSSVTAAGALGRPCGIRVDGGVVCWGYGAYGEPPAWVGPLIDVSLGHPVSCGVQADGAVACWDNRTKADFHIVEDKSPPAGEFVQVEVSSDSYCALRSDGTIACAYVGHGAGDDILDAPEGEFATVDMGADHACGIRSDGTVACWGSDGDMITREPSGP